MTTQSATTTAILPAFAMIVPDPAIESDYAWMLAFFTRREMSGEVGYANGRVEEGEANPFSHCLEHGPRRPFLGFRVDHVCCA